MRTVGLVVFIVCCAPIQSVLYIDAGLKLAGGTTISEYLRQHPALAVALMAVLLLGVAGFAVHLWWPQGPSGRELPRKLSR